MWKASSQAANPSGAPIVAYNLSKDAGQSKMLPLPVPVADGKGGLFTSMLVRPDLDYVEKKGATHDLYAKKRLGAKSRLTVSLQGTRLDTLQRPKAVGW